jgi:NAD(P)-dependent dehydrogenase (short-subunit alcohol dehydrogenase family)
MSEDRKLTGKVAIVFGGSRGIGAAAARRLAREGAAGIWPRLARDDANFVALPVIRPQTAVIGGSAGHGNET